LSKKHVKTRTEKNKKNKKKNPSRRDTKKKKRGEITGKGPHTHRKDRQIKNIMGRNRRRKALLIKERPGCRKTTGKLAGKSYTHRSESRVTGDHQGHSKKQNFF